MQKQNKRGIQKEETKNKIYETAKELFDKYGIDEVSVDSIVEAVGVSKGTFYVHFESKDILASHIIEDYVKEADSEYRRYMDSILKDKISCADLLILMVEKIADVIEKKIGYDNMRVLYKAHLSKTVNAESSISYNRDIYQIFSYIISNGVKNGEFINDIITDDLVHHLVLAMRGVTFEWCIRYDNFNLSEEYKKYFRLLLNGIMKKTY